MRFDEKSIILKDKYKVIFFKNKIQFELIKSKIKDESILKVFVNKIKDLLKISNISTDSIFENELLFSVNINGINENTDVLVEPTLKGAQYFNIYEGVDLSINVENETIKLSLSMRETKAIEKISLDLEGNSQNTIDNKGNVNISIDDIVLLIEKPTLENKLLDFNIEDNKLNLSAIEVSNDEVLSVSEASNELIEFSMKAISELYDIGTRKLLIPVDKSLFKYPYSVPTSLKAWISAPLIEDIYTENKITQIPLEVTGICPGKAVTIYIDKDETIVTPFVSYSVQLNFDGYELGHNGFKGIFAHMSDSFLGDKVYLCNEGTPPIYRNVDFLLSFNPGPTFEVQPVSEDANYYYYEVTLQVSLYKAPPITVNEDTKRALNIALGRNPDSTEPITRGELEGVVVLDASGISNLDISVLEFMPNLVELYLSNSEMSDLDSYYLQTLNKLEVLDISNNVLSDLSNIRNLTNLRVCNCSGNCLTNISSLQNLTNLEILNCSSQPSSTAISVFASRACKNTITDISVLSDLINLKEVDLSGNDITDITPLSDLYVLEKLDISNNQISNIQPLSLLQNLTYLNASNQLINYGDLLPIGVSPQYTFILDLDFILDLEGMTPCIVDASNDGYCSSLDSCTCESLVWENIMTTTDVYFEFEHDVISLIPSNFSGRVNVTLKTSI